MLVSHETPISMLEESRKYNSYCYALVHLFETNPEYYSFFKTSLTLGREVLLDNSIFELKKAFDPAKFANYVEELRPTYYVIPDVLEDAQDTIDSWKDFVDKYKNLPGLKIGVVQGKTYQDLVKCYRFMSENADYIAISFDYSWYQTIGLARSGEQTDTSHLERMASGRQYFIERLINDCIWDYNKPHHLLGCSLAREFGAYRNLPYKAWKSIRSCDTSNPVVAGIKGLRYVQGIGLYEKPSTLLADLINHKVSDEELDNILYNVNEFKRIIGQ